MDAFEGCSSLTSITIPHSVKTIGFIAFRCTALASITIPDSVTTIGFGTFSGCTSLTSITIPDSVTQIDFGAFDVCSSLRSITIPNNVTEIGFDAFRGCTALTSITIPDSVTHIGEDAFSECSSLTQVICNNPDLFTDHNIQNRDQIQFISTTDYFNDNYQDLLNTIENSGFNSNHVSSKELNLIIKLHQEDYLPDWKTIATTFKERSMNQIKDMLHYFGKTHFMPKDFNTLTLEANDHNPIYLNHLSMFLTSKEHTNLSMTAKNVTLRTKEKEEDQEPTFYYSIN